MVYPRLTAGSVVGGSGGLRKVRWARSGAGKSGGVRVIYSCHLLLSASISFNMKRFGC